MRPRKSSLGARIGVPNHEALWGHHLDSGDPQLFHLRGLHDRTEQSVPGMMMFPEPAMSKRQKVLRRAETRLVDESVLL
jgi:hypothetical protein